MPILAPADVSVTWCTVVADPHDSAWLQKHMYGNPFRADAQKLASFL